jgi:hypothetical protein
MIVDSLKQRRTSAYKFENPGCRQSTGGPPTANHELRRWRLVVSPTLLAKARLQARLASAMPATKLQAPRDVAPASYLLNAEGGPRSVAREAPKGSYAQLYCMMRHRVSAAILTNHRSPSLQMSVDQGFSEGLGFAPRCIAEISS